MDRPEGYVRWSPNASWDRFITVNLNSRTAQLFEATGHARPGRFDYQKLSKHSEFPAFSTCDWSPTIEGLVALGTSQGDVNLLRVDDNSNAYLTLTLKTQRACQAVAFSTTGLLAVGLDRVRTDSSLQIWDLNQGLAGWDKSAQGWGGRTVTAEPLKLEPSVPVTSVKFFEDQPQTLAIGIKNQCVRIHDLRDPSGSVVTFQTRCNNNVAIDYADSNYFASSSLDQPCVMVWDRRITSRSAVSTLYIESSELEELPWGSALRLDRAIEVGPNKSYIRQLRYCRDKRGTLGILSAAGQLQVLQTNKEYTEPSSVDTSKFGTGLLEVTRSYDLEYPYFERDHKRRFEDRVVSFDWVTLGTSDLQPRLVALRSNGSFEIMQTPAATAGQLSKLIPWRPPHRREDAYMELMGFADPDERLSMLGPLYSTDVTAHMPVFGPDRITSESANVVLAETIKELIESNHDPIVDVLGAKVKTDGLQSGPSSISRLSLSEQEPKHQYLSKESKSSFKFNLHKASDKQELRHIKAAAGGVRENEVQNLVMLRRAMDGYLFNCQTNKTITGRDHDLKEVWFWIASAEEAAKDNGMVTAALDLSYMGVFTIWMNSLGHNSKSRLIENAPMPDAAQWERQIAMINKRADRAAFTSVPTAKAQHRQLCLAICSFTMSPNDVDNAMNRLVEQGHYTRAAAFALFESMPMRAVELLRRGDTNLLFVAMALEIKIKGNVTLDSHNETWTDALKGHPQMAADPFLRAIYCYITTGDWAEIANETSLPLRDRVGIALRNFSDAQLTEWLSKQMEESIRTGNIEGIVLAGITDNMVDIFAKFIETSMDYQTAILAMSFCYPRYLGDARCGAWRKAYQAFLQRHRQFILRVKFEQQSTIKSRLWDGTPVIRPPPRQVTIRCLNCDSQQANDLDNTAVRPSSSIGAGSNASGTETRMPNPLVATGVHAGLVCPRCGSHLSRCAICMEIVGVPRSDRPEQSTDAAVRRMANFPTFCLKCKHVTHMDHSVAWFKRHVECPVPECHCRCNELGESEVRV